MMRCLNERELYAMAETRLSPKRATHVRDCPSCSNRVERLKALRAAMREATSPAAPDWNSVEARIFAAVRTDRKTERPAFRALAPLGLSFAAALLAVVALVVGNRRSEDSPTNSIAGPAFTPVAAGFGTAATEPPLVGIVLERIGGDVPARGGAVREGDSITAIPCGAVLTALGDDVAVDTRDGARFHAISLDAWRPTVRLDPGAFRISVTDGALSPELVVLAAHEELTLFSGTAEVLFLDDELVVRAMGEPLVAEIGGILRTLAPGESLRSALSTGIGVGAADWAFTAASPETGARMDSIGFTGPARGRLSKSVVREVLRENAEKMRVCYESALKRYPNLEVIPVTARLKIAVSGRVARVSIDGVDSWPELESCLATVFGEMRFPAPKDGEVELVAPLRLTPLE
jgi:hypothetical protein